MSRMPTVSILWLLTACSLLTSMATAQEGVELFDGKTLTGWHVRGGKATYSVEGDAIVGRSVPNTSNTFLCTDRHFSDFDLEYEFKIDPLLNSGVQIRSHDIGGRVTGYQIEIDADENRKRYWSAGIFDEARRGWLDDLDDNAAARNAFKPRQWNHVRVLAVGSRIQTWINNVPAADLLDSLTLSGFIGLQVHGVGGRREPLEVRWRNIRFRDLGAHRWRSLFDGVSVPAWATGARRVNQGLLLSPGDGVKRWSLPGEYDDFTVRAVQKKGRKKHCNYVL